MTHSCRSLILSCMSPPRKEHTLQQAHCSLQGIPLSSHPLHRSRPMMTCPPCSPRTSPPKLPPLCSSICLSRIAHTHTHLDCPRCQSICLLCNSCMLFWTQLQSTLRTSLPHTTRSLSPRRCPASQDTCPPRSLGSHLDEMRPQPRCICLPRT